MTASGRGYAFSVSLDNRSASNLPQVVTVGWCVPTKSPHVAPRITVRRDHTGFFRWDTPPCPTTTRRRYGSAGAISASKNNDRNRFPEQITGAPVRSRSLGQAVICLTFVIVCLRVGMDRHAGWKTFIRSSYGSFCRTRSQETRTVTPKAKAALDAAAKSSNPRGLLQASG